MIRTSLGTVAAVVLLLLASCASGSAQAIGGNASLSVSSVSSSVQLPASTATYPSLLITPSGGSQEVFFSLGGSTVTATTTSPALPSGGVCVNVGPGTYLAAITAASTNTLRLLQLNACPPR